MDCFDNIVLEIILRIIYGIQSIMQKNYGTLYVTGFGKTCIVHTSDFAHLEIHKNYREWYTEVKHTGIIEK